MALHKDLPDSELHEPKGIASALSDEVYEADGSGSGSWVNNFAYGQLAIDNGSDTNDIALSAATDSTLNTDSDYVKLNVTGLWQDDGSERTTVSASDGDITVDHPGVYEISFYCSLYNDKSAETDIAFKWGLNGTLSSTKLVDTFKGSGQRHSVSSSAIYSGLTTNDSIDLYVAADTSQTATISDAKFFIRMIKAS